MAIRQTSLLKRSFDSPDETRPAGAGQAQIINVDDMALMRITLEPGWRWSTHVQPLTGGQSCQAPHVQYIIAGRLHVKMDDGSEVECGPGDLIVVPPGHDGWVVGDEPFVCIDVTGGSVWAKSS